MRLTPRLTVLAVFALSVALTAGSAMAQPGGGRGPGGRGPGGGGPGGGGPGFGMRGGGAGGVMWLLRAEVIRTEVGIDDATAEKVREVAMESMRAGRQGFEGFRDLSEEQRRARFEEMRKQAAERTKELEKKVAEVVGMEKFGRLKEIELQMQGIEALTRSEVAEFLGLTEDQKAKIEELRNKNREAARAKMEEAMPGGFRAMRDMDEDARRSLMDKMRTVRETLQKELEKAIMGVLTEEQVAKLGKMMGEPFAKMEEAREQMRAGFGRGGDRGGDRGARGDRGGRGSRDGGGDRGRRGGGERRQQRPT